MIHDEPTAVRSVRENRSIGGYYGRNFGMGKGPHLEIVMTRFSPLRYLGLLLPILFAGGSGCTSTPPLAPAEANVRPGINDSYLADKDVEHWRKKFETESREIFVKRKEIADAAGVGPGMTVADIGAGTGLFTYLFADRVGAAGRVFAEDIMPYFVDEIRATAAREKIANLTAVLGTADNVSLAQDSLDLAFVCDVYHHFEFPMTTLASIRNALKPDGVLVIVDFIRIPGQSPEWVLNHVRAGQDVVEKELAAAGFEKIDEKPVLKENWIARFRRTR